MHFSKIFAITALLATGTIASPTKPEKPNKPAPPAPVKQSNSCGKGGAPYCCNTDNFGKYTTCYDLATVGGTCSQTTVCCNANNSIQICLGNAVII